MQTREECSDNLLAHLGSNHWHWYSLAPYCLLMDRIWQFTSLPASFSIIIIHTTVIAVDIDIDIIIVTITTFVGFSATFLFLLIAGSRLKLPLNFGRWSEATPTGPTNTKLNPNSASQWMHHIDMYNALQFTELYCLRNMYSAGLNVEKVLWVQWKQHQCAAQYFPATVFTRK